MKILFLILKGTVVGGANVMPGVSGATLAVILRIYDTLIESINNLFKDMKKSLKFLVPVGIGMVIGILAIGELVNFLLLRFSFLTLVARRLVNSKKQYKKQQQRRQKKPSKKQRKKRQGWQKRPGMKRHKKRQGRQKKPSKKRHKKQQRPSTK